MRTHRSIGRNVTTRTAEYPRPDHFLLHISDTHVLAGDGLLYDRVASERHLRTLFDEFEASGGRPEAIVFTGDLADRGEPDAYDRIRRIVDPVADRLGAQVIWVMGNHDERSAFRRGLLGERGGSRPVDRVDEVNGLRVITLDSTVPGHHHGEVAPEQLDWLAEELSIPAPHGTVLAMHHPPVPSVLDLAASVELRDQAGLAEVVAGSDIRSIIAGHLHYSSTATFAGTRGRDGARAFNLVHVYPNTVLHSVVPLGSFPALDWIDAGESARRLSESGISIADATTAPVPKEPPFTMPIPVLAG